MKKMAKGSKRFWYKQWVELTLENVQLSRALDMACEELTHGEPDGKISEFLKKALNDKTYIEHKYYLISGKILTPPTQPK